MPTTPRTTEDAPASTSRTTTAPPGRVVHLPWGDARVQEEVAIEGSASGERRIEVGIMRLAERDGGGQLLRFFYRSEGRVMRGPLTLREGEIDELAAALANAPELRVLLGRLLGEAR